MKTYKDIIDEISSKIHTGLIDFSIPRCAASMPSQASSEFITNKQQGDWAEDLKVVRKWIDTYNVPHFYVQVFFDKVYGISYQHILELISNPDLEGSKYFVEQDAKNQNKTTIKIPSQDGVCLAEAVTEPDHHSVRKELNKGRLLYYVKFDGGQACLDPINFEELFGIRL